MPILEGLDGVQKMSKSLGNYIGVTEPPSEIFGKVLSISDTLMLKYYELLTDISLDEVKTMHPMEAKKRLAKIIVARFYSENDATKAQKEFEKVFSNKNLPTDIVLKTFKEKNIDIVKIIVESGLAESNGEAKRLIKQGGVKVSEKVLNDEKTVIDLTSEKVIQVGKRKFVRVKCE